MNRRTTAKLPPDARLSGSQNGHVRPGDKSDVIEDGFIHLAPRTHDISLVSSHVSSIQRVAAEINDAVQAVWPKRHEIRYSKAHVLLLSWEDDDLGVDKEIKDLRRVFEQRYRFEVEEHRIPSKRPDKNVKKRVLDFLGNDDNDDNDGNETLLVVYYAGHARRGEQSNEGSIWFANRADPSIAVPSGGIQSLFEEAYADVLLLYDCCHSASVPTCKLQLAKGGVTEVIAACGYEAVAPEVDDHSFTKALMHSLVVASKELPFSVGELHSRILSQLKCWAPKLARDADGNFFEKPDGQLAYERQPRKTPIYSILSETRPRRSIVLGPLPLTLHPSLGDESDSPTPSSGNSATSTPSTSSSESPPKKRKVASDESDKYAQVLITVRVDQVDLNEQEWVNWIREMPSDGKGVHVEGRWDSFSTLILLRMPVAVWDLLPDSPAYDFVGFVTSENRATGQETRRLEPTSAYEKSNKGLGDNPWISYIPHGPGPGAMNDENLKHIKTERTNEIPIRRSGDPHPACENCISKGIKCDSLKPCSGCASSDMQCIPFRRGRQQSNERLRSQSVRRELSPAFGINLANIRNPLPDLPNQSNSKASGDKLTGLENPNSRLMELPFRLSIREMSAGMQPRDEKPEISHTSKHSQTPEETSSNTGMRPPKSTLYFGLASISGGGTGSRRTTRTPTGLHQRLTCSTETEHIAMSAVTTQLEQVSRHSSLRLELRPQSPSTREFPPNASIVLIGSRGSGKRSLGFIGATHLGRRLITEDHYFQEATGVSRGTFIRQYGNREFYKRNVEVLGQMLDRHRSRCVIEFGMGSLAKEAQRALFEYSKANPVIYITRDSQRIRNLLKLGEQEAACLEAADLSHRNCSNLEYYNLYDPSCDDVASSENGSPNVASRLKYAKEDFSSFLDFLTGQGVIRSGFESPFSIAAIPPEFRSFTYALSIGLSSIPDLDLEELEAGADAVQLKIDAIVPDMQKFIGKQVATIRRKLGVPIIYHVEENVFEGSNYSIPEKEDIYFSLLEYGLRFGVEYIVVDLKYSSSNVTRLVQHSGRTKVIGHHLAREENSWGWDDESWMIQYRRAKSLGCDMVRFARATSKESDNETVRAFRAKIEAIPDHLPVIAYNLGGYGRPSLIENRIFTPVTHPIMQSTVSLSQIRQFLPTAAKAMQALYQKSILDPLHFYHLGASVFYSLSPAMHSAAYQVCGINNDFHSLQVGSLEDIHHLCQDLNFGGAAITQPFKVQILTRISAKSYHAKAIGAVNTLLPLRMLPDISPLDGSTQSLLRQASHRSKAGPVYAYYGDNTDWIGIITCLRRNISPWNVVQPSKTTGLVIGAGGMARAAIYAMIQLGCRKVFLFNRTIENAENVARHFNSWASGLSSDGEIVRALKSPEENWPSNFKFPTMIVSCVPARSVGPHGPANFEMPLQWLGSPTGGVVVELAYLPLDTPLLRQIRRVREETKQAWTIVDGLEVLPEQAIAQFELMTGRKAPKRRMRLEVLQNYHRYEVHGTS